MNKIYVAIQYGGEWRPVEGKWRWIMEDTDHCKTTLIDRSISWDEFIDKVCEKIGIDRFANTVDIFRSPTSKMIPPRAIKDQDDWDAFMYLHRKRDEMELFMTYTPCAVQSPTIQSPANRSPVRPEKLPTRRSQGDTSQDGGVIVPVTVDQHVSLWDNINFGVTGGGGGWDYSACDTGGGGWDYRGGSDYGGGGLDYSAGDTGGGGWDYHGGSDTGGSGWDYRGGSDYGGSFSDDSGRETNYDVGGGSDYFHNVDENNDDVGCDNDDGDIDGNEGGVRDNSDNSDDDVGIVRPDILGLCDRDGGGRYDGSNLVVGQTFKNKDEFSYVVGRIALEGKFEFVVYKSDRDRKILKCVQKLCKWKISASRKKTTEEFVIRAYKNIHTCSLVDRSGAHRQASSRLIGNRVQDQFLNAIKPPNPAAVKQFMRSEENITISYGKAWRGKQIAQNLVRGTFEENFAKLPSYCYILEQRNPGTCTRILTDANNEFRYFFMAIGAAIQGFKYMRDVITIDASFMTNKYKGTLLIASASDSEHHSFPIAWGVGDAEDTNCWTWFLECLQELIPDRSDLVFVSDRGQPIINAVSTVYPLAEHGHCYWHIMQNIKKNYKVKELVGLFHMAACSYTIPEFRRHFSELRQKSEGCAKWLEETVRFEKWSRAHHRVNRYEVMTSNPVEVLNSVMKVAKEYPICAMIEFIVDKMGEWFFKRREEAVNFCGVLTPKREATLRERFEEAPKWVTRRLSRSIYKVQSTEWRGVVDLANRTCECGVFQIDMIPCEHALAAACDKESKRAGEYAYELTSPYFTVQYMLHAYVDLIVPVPSEDQWMDIPDDVKNVIVLPPMAKRSRGRPRVDRFKSQAETSSKRSYRCSKCKGEGHNAQNCSRLHEEQVE